jgi:sodium/hydrogen antiporter
VEPVDVAFALLGVGALLAGILPRVLEHRPLSMPIAFLGLGMLVFLLPTGLPSPDPLRWPQLTTHLTEVGVIVALMGAGLKIDRPLSRARWSSTWRLLAVAMPLCIGAVALLGWWWAGLVPGGRRQGVRGRLGHADSVTDCRASPAPARSPRTGP